MKITQNKKKNIITTSGLEAPLFPLFLSYLIVGSRESSDVLQWSFILATPKLDIIDVSSGP